MPISTTSRLSRTARVGLALSAIILYSAGLLIAAAYVSYKAPIKPDRYGHAFSSHLADRLTAYALWLKSPSKTMRATMPIEKISRDSGCRQRATWRRFVPGASGCGLGIWIESARHQHNWRRRTDGAAT